MQTFLPYPNFAKSARVLDNKRLGKQRVECYQILRAITDSSYGWQNHPAVNMWRGYECQLVRYVEEIIYRWHNLLGYQDTILVKIKDIHNPRCEKDSDLPLWLNEKFCSSHRAALLAKDYDHYSQFGWTEDPKIDYWWPSKHGY